MKEATEYTQAEEHGESLEQVKQMFARWRAGRKRGERISGALWAAAVALVERHGLERTARELRVDFDGLKKQLERINSTQTSKREIKFVEMFAPPTTQTLVAAPLYECVVEMENARGGKMRIDLKGFDGLDRLTDAFWRAP